LLRSPRPATILLAEACRKVVQVSAVLAEAGIVVDAKDASAGRFCAHFGFVPMPGQSSGMLLPAKALPAQTVQDKHGDCVSIRLPLLKRGPPFRSRVGAGWSLQEAAGGLLQTGRSYVAFRAVAD
jgi:hypothetical protein